MLTEIKAEEAAGRVVRDIHCDEGRWMVITFEDDTFTAFVARTSWDEPFIEADKLDMDDFGDSDLIASGIMTWEEKEERNRQKKAEEKRREEATRVKKEAEDRAQYERLKAKFG